LWDGGTRGRGRDRGEGDTGKKTLMSPADGRLTGLMGKKWAKKKKGGQTARGKGKTKFFQETRNIQDRIKVLKTPRR